MFKLLKWVMFFVFLTFVTCETETQDEEGAARDEFTFTDENFKDKTQENAYFIMFYAPWCGHCQRLKPVWEKLTDEINNDEDLEVKMEKVDCTKQTKLCSDQGVLGYPTLKLYKPGEEGERYQGARDEVSLKKFMKKSEEEPAKEAEVAFPKEGLYDLTVDTFDAHVAVGSHFIKFYAPWCGHCRKLEPTWMELAKAHMPSDENADDVKISRIDCTAHREPCTKYEVRGYPTLLWFKDGEKVQKYSSGRDIKNLEKFVKEMITGVKEEEPVVQKPPVKKPPTATKAPAEEEEDENSPVLILTDKNFDFHVATDVTFVKFYAPWCGFCKKLAPTWEELAVSGFDDYDVEVKIAKVDCTKNSKVCKEYEVKGYPSLLIFKDGEMIEKYQAARTLTGFKAFISKHVDAIVDNKDEL